MKSKIMKWSFLFVIVCLSNCVDQPQNNVDSKVGDQTETIESMVGKNIGEIKTTDPELNYLMDSTSKVEIIGEGYNWAEGPVWVKSEEFLLFSDVPENTIYKWKEVEGVSKYLSPSGFTGSSQRGGETGSNGLLIDAEGSLVLCQHGDRRIARMKSKISTPQSEFQTIADTYKGQKFNSPNDAAFHENGDLFLTDPPYGLEKNMNDPLKEIPFQGVYQVTRNGDVVLVTDQLSRPNGIAFLDRYNLFVANSDSNHPVIQSFKIDKDGRAIDNGVFFDFTEFLGGGRKGSPDGLKVGKGGYIFATGPGGLHVLTPKGKHLGYVSVDVPISNCAIDASEEHIYMTADMYLLRLKFKD